jgi:hypothetical protein
MIDPKDLLRCGAHTMTWNRTPTCEGWNEYYLPIKPDPEAHLGMDLSLPYLSLTVDAPGPKDRPEQMVTLRVPPNIVVLTHITTLDDFLEIYRLLSGIRLSTRALDYPDIPIEEYLTHNRGPETNRRALEEIAKLKGEIDERILAGVAFYNRCEKTRAENTSLRDTIRAAANILATWTEP